MKNTLSSHEINKGNKLIAEFMGWKVLPHTDNNCFSHPDTFDILFLFDNKTGLSDFHYDSSFNELIPVVKEIKSRLKKTNLHYYKDWIEVIDSKVITLDIVEIYTMAIEVIEWLNKK